MEPASTRQLLTRCNLWDTKKGKEVLLLLKANLGVSQREPQVLDNSTTNCGVLIDNRVSPGPENHINH